MPLNGPDAKVEAEHYCMECGVLRSVNSSSAKKLYTTYYGNLIYRKWVLQF